MNTYEAALREIETLPTGDPFHAMVKARQIARKALAVPAPPSAQEVVGPQGREDFIQKVIGYTFGNEGFRFKAMSDKIADFMRAHWPVSEGEGMRPVEPAAVDNVALLEWVAKEKWQYRGEGEWYRNERTKYKNKFVGKNTAALIQEFINRKTKEV